MENRMQRVLSLLACLALGCAEEKPVRLEHHLTTAESKRKIELVMERDLLANAAAVVGRDEPEEIELLTLANYTATKGNERWYGFRIPRAGRPADYDGPAEESDGSLMLHVVNGTITDAKYVTAEF